MSDIFQREESKTDFNKRLMFLHKNMYSHQNRKLKYLLNPGEKKFIRFDVIVRPDIAVKGEYVSTSNIRAKEMIFMVNSHLKSDQGEIEQTSNHNQFN